MSKTSSISVVGSDIAFEAGKLSASEESDMREREERETEFRARLHEHMGKGLSTLEAVQAYAAEEDERQEAAQSSLGRS